MCGIAGLMEPARALSADELEATALQMADAVAHRGPDDRGAWSDPETGIALGHRRLSILDLSAAGHQPMFSTSGRWVVSYNGEIYNFQSLRSRLGAQGCRFVGTSDTEVLLAALDVWGLDATLTELNGMFGLAIWDRSERTLHLVRDRLGEKPLYYGWSTSGFVFGSELKAVLAHPRVPVRIDRGALALYFRHNCVPAPFSIYEGISKVLPGECVSVSGSDVSRRQVQRRVYWSARDMAERAVTAAPVSVEEALDSTRELLLDAVRLRMVADVPVGAFLSGGIDSALVTALMCQVASVPVRTFTIGFSDPAYDESDHAAAVAKVLGTDHTALRLQPAEAMAAIPDLPTVYDEPFADSSQLPTLLVSRLARQDITVALSGDGGDELFAGYNRHAWVERLWPRLRPTPVLLRRAAAAALRAPSPYAIDQLARFASTASRGRLAVRTPSTKVTKLARIMTSTSPEDMYRRLTTHWPDSASLVGAAEHQTVISDPSAWPTLPSATERLMLLDLVTYLPDDILTKVDRASMSVGLETRVPFLDPRLVEAAWRLPMSMKLRDGETKWVLRQLLREHLPVEMIDRPKMGFGVPLGDWVRGPMRDWAEDLLSPSALAEDELVDVQPVRQLWAAHLSGRVDASHELWDVLMFQAWRRRSPVAPAPVPPRPATASAGSGL